MTTIRSARSTSPSETLGASVESARAGTRGLLACGVVAGPLFIATALIQMLTRNGFDPVFHPMSLLSQGDLGWVQITNFVVNGLLFMAAAVGMRRSLRTGRGSTWGPRLIGAMGFAMVWGGVFVADPAGGFPPGTPPGPPEQFSWHSVLHNFAPPVAFWATAAACVIFARRFRGLGQPGWVAYCTATAVASIVLSIAAFPAADFRLLFVGVTLQVFWASILAARLMVDVSESSDAEVQPAPLA